MENQQWPELDYAKWKNTYDTLHMWMQIVGKVKLALCPFLNEWWQVAFYLTAKGMTTLTIPYEQIVFDINFDFIEHVLIIQTSDGRMKRIPLLEQPVAEFYEAFNNALSDLNIRVKIWKMPVEVENHIPFDEDHAHAAYEREYATRFWKILLNVEKIFEQYRASFFGKSSPVLFFWGASDLAETRFSGKPAPERKGVERMVRLAMDQEEINVGFWPGNEAMPQAAFYAYAYPEPEGFKNAKLLPEKAYYEPKLNEFILKYNDVRNSSLPEKDIADFLQSAYEAGANLAKWDRQSLERKPQ